MTSEMILKRHSLRVLVLVLLFTAICFGQTNEPPNLIQLGALNACQSSSEIPNAICYMQEEPCFLAGLDCSLSGGGSFPNINASGGLDCEECAEPDADGDGLSDGAELLGSTDPQNADSDGDGASDGAEVLALTDPLDAMSVPTPPNGVPLSQLPQPIPNGGCQYGKALEMVPWGLCGVASGGYGNAKCDECVYRTCARVAVYSILSDCENNRNACQPIWYYRSHSCKPTASGPAGLPPGT